MAWAATSDTRVPLGLNNDQGRGILTAAARCPEGADRRSGTPTRCRCSCVCHGLADERSGLGNARLGSSARGVAGQLSQLEVKVECRRRATARRWLSESGR